LETIEGIAKAFLEWSVGIVPVVIGMLAGAKVASILISILKLAVPLLSGISAGLRFINVLLAILAKAAKALFVLLLANPIVAVIVAIIAAILGLVYVIWQNWDAVVHGVSAGLYFLRDLFVSVLNFILRIIRDMLSFISPEFGQAFENAVDNIMEIFSRLPGWFYENIIQPIAGLIASVIGPLMSAWETVSNMSPTQFGANLMDGISDQVASWSDWWNGSDNPPSPAPPPPPTTGGVSNYGPSYTRGNTNISTETNVGSVNVYTQATDAQGTGEAVRTGVVDATSQRNAIVQLHELGVM